MRLNRETKPDRFTHEGAPAKVIDPIAQLRRLVMSCLLWEREFYVDGRIIAEQIAETMDRLLASDPNVVNNVDDVISIVGEARHRQHLRHVPLYLAALYAAKRPGDPRTKHLVESVVDRADEIAEFLAIWCQVKGMSPKAITPKSLTGQIKKGLALAFHKFDEYQFAKYNRDNAITLVDAARLVHPRSSPAIDKLMAGTLEAPDTWEVALSRGADKRETWERLLREDRLGYLALLRNLRNMMDAGVDQSLIVEKIRARKGARRVLPFRYVAAAKHAPWAAHALDDAVKEAVVEGEKFPGLTLVLVDVSGSMAAQLSHRSEMSRMEVAAALAGLWWGDNRVFTFSNHVREVPNFGGLTAVTHILQSQPHGGTMLGSAVEAMNRIAADRLVVISDEQSHQRVPDPVHPRAYMINVASNQNGVGYGRWTHVDGWSEGVFRWMRELEAATLD